MVVLFVLVVVYLCVGAAIFSHIEGDPEIERRLQLEAFLKNFIGIQVIHCPVQVVIFPFLFHNISFELMQLLKHFPIGISSWNSSTNVIAEVNLFPLRIDIFDNNTTNGCFLVTICLECMLF